jgi:hypothetical protein
VPTPHHLTFRSLALPERHSAFPPEHAVTSSHGPQGIRAWYQSHIQEKHPETLEKAKESEALLVIEKEIEAALVGLVLGLADAQFKGLDVKKVPIDGVASLIALLTSLGITSLIPDPNHPLRDLGRHMSNVGSDLTAIFTYRKSKAWREDHLSTPKSTTVPNVAGDPIVDTARNLGNE